MCLTNYNITVEAGTAGQTSVSVIWHAEQDIGGRTRHFSDGQIVTTKVLLYQTTIIQVFYI